MDTEFTNRAPRTAIEDFGWSLGAVLRAYHSAVGEVLGDFPHGPRGYQVLHTVIHDDQPSQLALATYLGIDRTVMTYLIDDLITAGLVERQPNPADRRQRKIVGTDTGRETLAEQERRVQGAQDAVLAPLHPEERTTLCSLVRRVARDTSIRENPCDVAEEMLGTQPRPVGAASR